MKAAFSVLGRCIGAPLKQTRSSGEKRFMLRLKINYFRNRALVAGILSFYVPAVAWAAHPSSGVNPIAVMQKANADRRQAEEAARAAEVALKRTQDRARQATREARQFAATRISAIVRGRQARQALEPKIAIHPSSSRPSPVPQHTSALSPKSPSDSSQWTHADQAVAALAVAGGLAAAGVGIAAALKALPGQQQGGGSSSSGGSGGAGGASSSGGSTQVPTCPSTNSSGSILTVSPACGSPVTGYQCSFADGSTQTVGSGC